MIDNRTKLDISTDAPLAGMQCYQQPYFTLTNGCGVDGLRDIKDNTVKCILTDPPYLYLKNQKLEKEFDELRFFSECKRILVDDGFVILFGRGKSFYRWNTMLSDLGFEFKEEIIWNKNYGSSPLMAITRVHETIAIFTKKNGVIKKVKVPYEKMKDVKIADIKRDIDRIKTVLSNKKAFENLEKYLNDGELSFDGEYNASTTITNGRKRVDRVVSTAQMIINGMNEKSIITNIRDHYTSIHPTQKPVELLVRLLNLTSTEGDVIVDSFSGSCSTGVACLKSNRQFIGFEIDIEYYQKSVTRIQNCQNESGLFQGCW